MTYRASHVRSMPRRVTLRFAASQDEKDYTKFVRLRTRVEKILGTMPRLFKTYDNQAHGYRSHNPVKAALTLEKIRKKVETYGKEAQKAHDLAVAFDKRYKPTTDEKTRYVDDFRKWITKSDKALVDLRDKLRTLGDDSLTIVFLSSGIDGKSHVSPGYNPIIDIKRAMGGLDQWWQWLAKPDPDPILIPKDGTDLDRFMAFLTPTVKRLAKGAAQKLKKDKAKAAVLAWSVLEDVNAPSESSQAETVLSPLVGDEASWEDIQGLVGKVSQAVDYGVVEAGAFGVALMQEVGEKSYADTLAKTLSKSFAKYTTA